MSEPLRTVNVGLIGLGTVGGGVARLINSHHDEYLAAYGIDLKLTRACALAWEQAEAAGIEREAFTSDWHDVVSDPAVDIVVELIGGEHPATEIFTTAFENGKHVVSANKALLGRHVETLAEKARACGVQIKCEASCGGGIPIVSTLEHDLVGNKILTIAGILNGTTNYILTKMYEEGWGFDEALKMAQKLGYAERNPEADIEGYDTCRKIAILTAAASGQEVDYEQIPTEGITKLTDVDFSYAARLGASIKLFGTSICRDGRYYLEVAPVFINARNPLYSVSGVFNGILLNSNMLGESMYYGSGAGKLPTASAVVGDMIAAVQLKDRPAALGWTGQRLEVLPVRQLPWKYFARFEGSREEKKTLTEELFGKVRWLELAGLDEFAILTGPMTGEEFDRAAGQLGGLRRAIRAQV